MWMDLDLPVAGRNTGGHVRMLWDFSSDEWRIIEDSEHVWPQVSEIDHGRLEREGQGAIRVWEEAPGSMPHLVAVFWTAPESEEDQNNQAGFAQLCEPRTVELSGHQVAWRAEPSAAEPPLSPLRELAQQVLDSILPAPYLSSNYMANGYATKDWKVPRESRPFYTNCVEFPAYYAMVLGCHRKFWPGYPKSTTPGYKTPDKDGHPLVGDIYVCCKTANHDGSTAHIGVVRDTNYEHSHGLTWRTGDYGQTAGGCAKDPSYQGGFDGIFLLQKYDPDHKTLQQFHPGSKPARAIHAWIDIEEFYNS